MTLGELGAHKALPVFKGSKRRQTLRCFVRPRWPRRAVGLPWPGWVTSGDPVPNQPGGVSTARDHFCPVSGDAPATPRTAAISATQGQPRTARSIPWAGEKPRVEDRRRKLLQQSCWWRLLPQNGNWSSGDGSNGAQGQLSWSNSYSLALCCLSSWRAPSSSISGSWPEAGNCAPAPSSAAAFGHPSCCCVLQPCSGTWGRRLDGCRRPQLALLSRAVLGGTAELWGLSGKESRDELL